MVRITEDLVRKKAEHNEREIFSLEELSLHQENIEKIENLDKWCKHLKILYLQSNLIPKIENVGRLKKLVYLNLALNNVEVIENLEGCESLEKLDLTVNFVGELTSIECLKRNIFFKELYLTGNPCSQYEGYRDYVIATLPHLKTLDGTTVEKSERIIATQNYGVIRARVIQQQIEYKKKREKEKEEARQEEEKERLEKEEEEKVNKPGFDGTWYTDINVDKNERTKRELEQLEKEHAKDKEFWDSKSVFSPEERIKAHKKQEEQKDREKKKEEAKNPPKPPRRLFAEDGRPLNVNESKINFKLTEDETGNSYLLDYNCYKYLETSLIDVDVQPHYIRIKTKGKIFQLALDQEVNADSSTCQRSQITGNLLVTMPKAKQIVKPAMKPANKEENKENVNNTDKKKPSKTYEKLEVDEKARKTVDIGDIVKEKSDNIVPPLGSRPICKTRVERPNSEQFVDNPDVPPLE
ncbi:dynein axonemal assembly factor 11-like [Mercenaria mercenaria]|uniref:dynein axonemal assembly factor 11-like n=1 Tax=Mercenaria mercenaria TaxID=6596 RepID=UPI00234F9E56|nr:dynein axonemal assembly factor 11-like [Mercenaria mercenaria]